MDGKHLGLIIAFGPEVRSFLYSGLVEDLARDYHLTVFTFMPLSKVWQDVSESIRVMPLPSNSEPAPLKRWRHRAAVFHSLWLEKLGGKKWRHYLQNQRVNSYQHVKGALLRTAACRWTAEAFFRLEAGLARRQGTSPAWANIYRDVGVDMLAASSYGSERTLPALQTAANLGLQTVIIPNSWKDVFAKPHLPFLPTRLLVWSASDAVKFKTINPWMAEKTIDTVGSLHLQAFLSRSGLLPKEEFLQKAGLNPERPYISYTAASPQAVKHEENLVAAILEAIRQGQIPRHPQVLLRINPMEDGSRFENLSLAFPHDLIVQRPAWEWSAKRDWCCPLQEDHNMWLSSVHYAAVNVSIPSTVTLEFAVCAKPVINICFDLPENPDPASSNRRFWEGDFYADIRENRLARPVFSYEDLVQALAEVFARPDFSAYEEGKRRALAQWLPVTPTEKVKGAIDGMLKL